MWVKTIDSVEVVYSSGDLNIEASPSYLWTLALARLTNVISNKRSSMPWDVGSVSFG